MKKRQSELDVDGAPLCRTFFEVNPAMWPRIDSFVPAGWDSEVANALQSIVNLSSETGVKIGVAQIKSKMAGLRIYLDIKEKSAGRLEVVASTAANTRLRSSSSPGSVRERATSIVDAAEKRCTTRCELCGAVGMLRNKSGWLVIACDLHAAES